MYICDCGKEFENSQQFNSHQGHCEAHMFVKYGTLDKFNAIVARSKETVLLASAAAAEKANSNKQQKLAVWVAEGHTCEKCGKIMTEKYGSGRFCCRACANSRLMSVDTKTKIATSLSENETVRVAHMKQHEIIVANYNNAPKFCSVCNTALSFEDRFISCCSDACRKIAIQRGALKGATSNQRRSRNEIYFCNLCEQYFNSVKHNEPIFNGWDADVIIEDIKYAILWNGPWHYRKITEKHSVEQVQNRDRIKLIEIEKAGYTAYIIKDDGDFNKAFVEEQFNLFISSVNNDAKLA